MMRFSRQDFGRWPHHLLLYCKGSIVTFSLAAADVEKHLKGFATLREAFMILIARFQPVRIDMCMAGVAFGHNCINR